MSEEDNRIACNLRTSQDLETNKLLIIKMLWQKVAKGGKKWQSNGADGLD